MTVVWTYIVLVVIVVIEVIAATSIWLLMKKGDIRAVVDDAVTRAAYQPTVFRIYDKSTENVCNRLIVVSPFDWYIWACREELYILNPEGGIRCAANTTPAIRVYADQFVESCLKINYNTILEEYTKKTHPKIVPYDIEGTTFTILSAINILAEKWITFNKTYEPKFKMYTISEHKNTAPATTHNYHQHYDERKLSNSDVIKITRNNTKTHEQLSAAMRKHTPKNQAVNLENVTFIDGRVHPEHITLYQHTPEYDSRSFTVKRG